MPLLTSLGWQGTAHRLIEKSTLPLHEMSLDGFLESMAVQGFNHRKVTTNGGIPAEHLCPCLLINEAGDPFVLIKMRDKKALVFDGKANAWVDVEPGVKKFSSWTFYPLEESVASILDPQKKWFERIFYRFGSVYFYLLIAALVTSLFSFATPLFMMTIFNHVLGAKDYMALVLMGVGVLIYILSDLGLDFIRSYMTRFLSARFGHIISLEVCRRLLHMPTKDIADASLTSQISKIRDLEVVQNFFAGGAVQMLLDVFFLPILLLGMFVLAGEVTLITLATFPIAILFLLIIHPVLTRINRESGMWSMRKQDFVLGLMSNLRSVKYTASKNHWYSKFDTLAAESSYASFQSSKMQAVMSNASSAIVSVSGILTIGMTVELVMSGSMSPGAIMGVMLLVWRVLAPIKSGYGLYSQVRQIRGGVDQLNQFMSTQIEATSKSTGTLPVPLRGGVEFSNVGLKYKRDSQAAVSGLTFAISRGECLGIVGHAGCGGSSVLKLILGLYQPSGGRILFDGMNSQQLDVIGLRRMINYCPEDNTFIPGTIAQNMRLIDLSANDEVLHKALDKLGALQGILALPEGIHTPLKSNERVPMPLSLQRCITLSRIFVRSSPIILLDQPEKGLEEGAQIHLIKELKAFKARRITIILVTHDAKFLELADKMLWLDNGKSRKFGTRAEVEPEYNKTIT